MTGTWIFGGGGAGGSGGFNIDPPGGMMMPCAEAVPAKVSAKATAQMRIDACFMEGMS